MIGSCISILNDVGSGFCHYAAAMLIQSSILIALLLVVDLFLRKRVRAVVRYWLWMLVFVKLILPPTLYLPTGVGCWFGDYLSTNSTVMAMPEPTSRCTAGYALGDAPTAPPPVALVESVEAPIPVSPKTLTDTGAPAIVRSAPLPALTWQAALFLAWLGGISVLGVFVIRRVLVIRGYVVRGEHAQGSLTGLLNECRHRLGIRRTVELRITHQDISPAAYGVFRPKILLSASALGSLSPDRLRTILIHELAHIKRGDLWMNLTQSALQVVYFYNPLVWLANAIVRQVREQAVDEMVLVCLGNKPADYSSTLVDIAELALPHPSAGLQLIGVVESKKALAQRVRHIMTRPIPKTARLGIIGLAAIVLIAAVFLPMARAKKAAAISEVNANVDVPEQQRVRELIYVLRNSAGFSRIDQWASAIRELAEIGEAAVPELTAELDRTERDPAIRAIAFTLRAINDPRAAPALIRALAKSRADGSDCGVAPEDPNLLEFMALHQIDRDRRMPPELGFDYGRSVREVTAALEKITGHSEGHEHFHAHDSNDNRITGMYDVTPEIAERQERYRQAVAERWQLWWDEHWSEFLSEKEPIPPAAERGEDLVDAAGAARFGVPFPSGQGVLLSPVRELVLAPTTFRDAKAFLDLETGRQFFSREGALPENRFDFAKWCTQTGVDIWIGTSRFEGKPLFKPDGWNMHTWQVDNSRWDSFEEEVANASRIELPTRGPRGDFLNVDPVTGEFHHRDRPVTFLFTTAAGGSGIIQIDGPTDDPSGVLIRYRMIEKPGEAAAGRPEPILYAPKFTNAGSVRPVIERVVLSATNASDSALDLDTGKLSSPPAAIRYPSLSKRLLEETGIDVIALPDANGTLHTLTTFDMKVMSVSPQLYNSPNPRKVCEMLWLSKSAEQSGMYVGGGTIPDKFPVFFLFETREGGQGLLEIAGLTDQPRGIRIRYRMIDKPAQATARQMEPIIHAAQFSNAGSFEPPVSPDPAKKGEAVTPAAQEITGAQLMEDSMIVDGLMPAIKLTVEGYLGEARPRIPRIHSEPGPGVLHGIIRDKADTSRHLAGLFFVPMEKWPGRALFWYLPRVNESFEINGIPPGEYYLFTVGAHNPRNIDSVGLSANWPRPINIRADGQPAQVEIEISGWLSKKVRWWNFQVFLHGLGHLNAENVLAEQLGPFGRVTDSDGGPLAYAEINVRGLEPDGQDWKVVSSPDARTNQQGYYGVAPLDRPYFVSADFHEPLKDVPGCRWRHLRPNKIFEGKQEINFQFAPWPARASGGGTIEGTVVDANGEAIPSFTVDVRGPRPSGWPHEANEPWSESWGLRAAFANGKFIIEDVPAGACRIRVVSHKSSSAGGATLGTSQVTVVAGKTVQLTFEVEDWQTKRGYRPFATPGWGMRGRTAEEPREPLPELKVGEQAPAFEIQTIADKKWALADYRGKLVLLCFWQAHHQPTEVQFPYFRAAYEAFGADERFEMMSLVRKARKLKDLKEYVSGYGLNWNHALMDDEVEQQLTRAYGVRRRPSVILIGPDGKIIARNLKGNAMSWAIEKALKTLPAKNPE